MNYAIMSSSFRLINMELKKIINIDNVVRYNYNDISFSDILLDANYVDLFSTEKYIVVYNTSLNESDQNALKEYLKNPSINHLILVSSKKITVPKEMTVIDKTRFNFRDFKPIIYDYLKQKKFSIDETTLFIIMNNCSYNFDLIMNELDKIMLYYRTPCKIKKEDVENIVAHSLVDNANKLVEAVIDKNYDKMFSIYDDLKRYKMDGISLVTIIGKAFINILYAKKMYQDKLGTKDIAKRLGLKDFAAESYIKYGYNMTEKYLINEIDKLATLDYEMKKGHLNPEHAIFSYFISI